MKLKVHKLHSALLALALLGAAGSTSAASATASTSYNSASGYVRVWATGGSDLTYTHDVITDLTFFEDATAVGPSDPLGVNNTAWAGFNFDLARGAVGAFAMAYNNRQFDWSVWDWRYFDNSAAYSSVAMADDLYFTVPAGTYANPLKVRISGVVSGDMAASGNYTAWASFHAVLGVPGNPAVQPAWQLGDPFRGGIHFTNNATLVNEVFTLEAILLAPGTSLATSRTVGLRLGLALGEDGWISAKSDVWPDQHVQGGAQSVFGNTLRIHALEVPSGVTWSSSSGVFLTDIQPIPEPSEALLMTVGGAVVLAVTRRTRGRRSAGAHATRTDREQ